MTGKRTMTVLAATTLAAVVAGAASAQAPGSASLVIRHQVRGCHTWAVNGSSFEAAQSVTLRTGASITVTNNDVMPHKLVQTVGPAARIENLNTPATGMGMHSRVDPGMMAHMGARARITFSHKGIYVFATKAGEDYMSGFKTVGQDNVLRLKVTVA